MRSKQTQKRVFAASPFVAQVCAQDTKRAARWLKSGWFEIPYKPGAIAKALRALVSKSKTEDAFMCALRQLRMEQMTRIAYRDLAGWAELPETLAAVSELADAACQVALNFAEKALQKIHACKITAAVFFKKRFDHDPQQACPQVVASHISNQHMFAVTA